MTEIANKDFFKKGFILILPKWTYINIFTTLVGLSK
jgi:hypothetical protein